MTDVARLVYAGQRVQSLQKNLPLTNCWFDVANSNDLWFTKVKGSAIGSIYEVKIERGEDGKINAAYTNPAFTADRLDDVDQIAAWQALDKSARRFDRMRKMENRYAKDDDFATAVSTLNGLLRKARTMDEAEAIASMIRRKLLDNYYKGI